MAQTLAERLDAARTAAAVGPVLARGLVRLTGRDRQKFVHRISTQKVAGLAPGAAIHAAFLDVKAKVIAEGMLVVRADDVLVDVAPRAAEPLRAHLKKYVVMDQVQLEDVSAAWRVVPVLGPAGVELARARGASWPLSPGGRGDEERGGSLWETSRRGVPAVDVLLAEADADAFRSALVDAGAAPLEEDDLEVLRVLAGIPRYGADVDETRMPMEAALVRSAVSFDKGCYLGQEVVVRGTFRGQIQKGLVQLSLPAGTGPGAPLSAGGQEVGVVTSAVDAPEGRVGLGYLRRAHWKEGERLAVPGGEAVVRRVLVMEREG
jgi:folate-binding protein YgfZ